MAGDKRVAAARGAWLCFEDEAGQRLRPPKGRTWGRRGHTPVVAVSSGSGWVSLAGLLATKPGQPPRLLYRTRLRSRRKDAPRGFTEDDYIALLDQAHQRLGGPIVLVWDNLNHHVSTRMRQRIDRRPWLTVYQLPAYAPELNPVEGVWAHLKNSLANLAKHTTAQLLVLIQTRLGRIQRRPTLLTGLIARTHLSFKPP